MSARALPRSRLPVKVSRRLRSCGADPCASRGVLPSDANDGLRVCRDVDHECEEPEVEAGFVHDEEAAVQRAGADDQPDAADEEQHCEEDEEGAEYAQCEGGWSFLAVGRVAAVVGG